ncbi:hypothetical protein HUJ05_010603 [Dendroctonus ponderosae]|nr:hypothetical protein HUJ05_010603 [Dendroctonus ponderosae]
MQEYQFLFWTNTRKHQKLRRIYYSSRQNHFFCSRRGSNVPLLCATKRVLIAELFGWCNLHILPKLEYLLTFFERPSIVSQFRPFVVICSATASVSASIYSATAPQRFSPSLSPTLTHLQCEANQQQNNTTYNTLNILKPPQRSKRTGEKRCLSIPQLITRSHDSWNE